jgi:small subunit ribosomal protein S4e
MVKNHLKSLNAPRTWNVLRKDQIFVTKPNPGSHKLEMGLSINHILKYDLGVSKTTKDSKYMLNNKDCIVNGKPINDMHYLVGFMDTISLPKAHKHYRVTLNTKGKLHVIEIDEKEASTLISQISNKTLLKGGKVQINTADGRNFLLGKEKDTYKTSDSLVLDVPSQKIKKHIVCEEGATIILTSGLHIGKIAKIEKIEGNNVFIKESSTNETYQTLRKFIFVIGKDKPEVKVR